MQSPADGLTLCAKHVARAVAVRGGAETKRRRRDNVHGASALDGVGRRNTVDFHRYHDAAGLGSHADAIGRLHAELGLRSRAAPGAKHIDCRTTMGRTMLKGRMGDIPCDVELSLSVYHGGRITVIAQVYHPLSEADRPVCPATAHSKDAPLFDEDQLYTLAELI